MPQADGTADRADLSGTPGTRKAYELTDGHGHRAYAWRVDRTWLVESDDAALRRRVTRALQQPLWTTEDVRGEDSGWWSTRVLLQPDDPRYANRLLTRWGQIGLDDLDVEVVTLADRHPVLAAEDR